MAKKIWAYRDRNDERPLTGKRTKDIHLPSAIDPNKETLEQMISPPKKKILGKQNA
jgi:hypothetical protein